VSQERRSSGDGSCGDDLEARLRAVEVPGSPDAGERAWGAVGAAFAARRRVRRRRWRVAPRIAVAVVAGVLLLAVAAGATQPGAAVRGFVVRVLGGDPAPPPRARIGPLPPGRMLVTSPRGAWIIGRDGSRTLLGPYAGASWSPRGLFVVAWSGADVHAVAPDGAVHWTLRTPGRVAAAAWSPDGYRVAYRRAGGLGVVAGDGTAPRVLSASVAPAGPAWRPGTPHTLAWVDPAGRIVVRDVDSGALDWRSPVGVGAARALSWSADGRLALVLSADGLRLADPAANRVSRVRLPPGDRAVAAAWAPRGRRLAVVARVGSGDLTRVLVARGGVRIADRPVFTTTGRLASPAWSPDGSRVLVRWTDADEWLLLPAVARRPVAPVSAVPTSPGAPARGIVAIAPVARRFGGAPVVRGWCCAG
jgi:dipeptidyl aminopeptidase/acylaminoacyl peptidase